LANGIAKYYPIPVYYRRINEGGFYMKAWKHFTFAAFLVLFAASGIAMTGAEEPFESGTNEFIGRWFLEEDEDGIVWVELEIRASTFTAYCYEWVRNSRRLDFEVDGTYTYKGNTATWIDILDGETETGTWVVSGNTLHERFDGESEGSLYIRK
jgi:hypothetical protein